MQIEFATKHQRLALQMRLTSHDLGTIIMFIIEILSQAAQNQNRNQMACLFPI